MADLSRQEKLASAKRKLKQFQQKRSQFDPVSSMSHLGNTSLTSYPLDAAISSPSSSNRSPAHSSNPVHKDADIHKSNSPASSSSEPSDLSFMANQENSTKGLTAAEKIKQISTQLNGLMPQDGTRNGENPIVKDIQAFEVKNSELETSLVSCKRSNRQLSEQVNQQRKQIIQLQEQLKQQEHSDSSAKKFQEQKGLKEQLEVHIQTIGILVSEKTELQSNLASLQKKMVTKDAESNDATIRLTAVRQRVAELERIESNLQLVCDKQTQACRGLSNERDTLNGRLAALSLKMEEMSHQNSELLLKLQSKVKESEHKDRQLSSALSKLAETSHHATKQVQSPASYDNVAELGRQLEIMKREKEDNSQLLMEHQQLVNEMASEKLAYVERHNEEKAYQLSQINSLQAKIQAFTIDVGRLNDEKASLDTLVASLQTQLDMEAEKRSNTLETTETAVTEEIQRFHDENVKLENELDLQVGENRRLARLVVEEEDRIQELESAVARLGEEALDRVSLLESIQSDKETISRATQQNKQLKDQLEELQNAFVRTTNANAELTEKLQKQHHETQQFDEIREKLNLSMEELKDKDAQLLKLSSADQPSEEPTESVNVDELRREITGLTNQLNYQIELNHKLHHMEARAELTDRLQVELHSAQETINHLSTQNASLKQTLSCMEDPNSREDYSESNSEHVFESPTANSEQRQLSYANQASESEDSLTDEDETQSNADETLGNYKDEVRQLQSMLQKVAMERDSALRRLELEKKQSNGDFSKLKEHLNLQLQQQLQQQQRQVQEHFHEQLHDQQRKMTLLQEAFDAHKRQTEFEVDSGDSGENQLPYDALKNAFQQLQSRFRKIMDDKASMIDRLQEMEHENLQLASETETIGEYITLYQTQRQALRDKFNEKERLVLQLSRDHARMQSKVAQLQRLVTEVLAEKTGSEQQTRNLQELVNQRLTQQSEDGKHDVEVPKINLSAADTTTFSKIVNATYDNSRVSSRSVSVSESLESDSALLNDSDIFQQSGKAQQILQILQQLETSGEGYQRGWIAPNVRKKEFTPCKHCSRQVVVI